MNTFENMARQGDVLFIKVDEIPDTAVEAKSEQGKFIVAHSETGHHHTVLDRPDTKFYEDKTDPLQAWLEVIGSPNLVEHDRSFDTHGTITLNPGKYSVRRQRRAAGEAWARVID